MHYYDSPQLQVSPHKARAALALLLAVCMGALCSAQVRAETSYVIDKLLVGLHEEQALDSPILKVLPTGTELQVLKREGELAFVKEPEGVSGWVDAGYLMSEQPARALLEILDQQNKDLADELREAQAKIRSLPAGSIEVSGDTADLRKRYDDLRQTLASEKLKVGELQAELAALQGKSRLTAGNDYNLGQTTAETPAPQSTVVNAEAALLTDKNIMILALVTIIIGFAAGLYCMDIYSRRRHGGFRV